MLLQPSWHDVIPAAADQAASPRATPTRLEELQQALKPGWTVHAAQDGRLYYCKVFSVVRNNQTEFRPKLNTSTLESLMFQKVKMISQGEEISSSDAMEAHGEDREHVSTIDAPTAVVSLRYVPDLTGG
ncbi:hypothetical protein ANN_18833 [Periplaneta americana]|uniref:Uncharacterized protein n=1 Tax=Periplaneta americana TaxID=6978 RepID=A0ABQ8SQL2_PERAM|nr:hypothetical protein ANN_18833 [Periplaneta americana]